MVAAIDEVYGFRDLPHLLRKADMAVGTQTERGALDAWSPAR